MVMSRIRVGIYSFTFFLVIVFGLVLVSTMGLDEGLEAEDQAQSIISVDRKVASILPSAIDIDNAMGGIAPMIMEIDCSDISDRPPVTVKTKHLRIKTKGCTPLSVFNQNNEFQATLFQLGNESYSTDYISLADGKNQLVILRDEGESHPLAISLQVVSQ